MSRTHYSQSSVQINYELNFCKFQFTQVMKFSGRLKVLRTTQTVYVNEWETL